MAAFPYQGIGGQAQRALSFERLRAFLAEKVYPYSPYYRALMQRLALAPEAIRGYDDFRRLPVTTKAVLVENLADFTLRPVWPGEPGPHRTAAIDEASLERYRAAAAVPGTRDHFRLRPLEERAREQYLRDWQPIHFQFSGGTTGRSARTGYTHRDLERQFAAGGAWWYALNDRIGPETRTLNLLPAAPHLGIYATLIVPLLNAQPNMNTFGGKILSTERQVEIAAEDPYGAIIAIPSYLIHWLRTARHMMAEGRIAGLPHFRTAFCVGEPLTEAYRNLLRAEFTALGSQDIVVLEGMSSTELRAVGFYECAEGSKLHLDPENFFVEVLHPETQEPVGEGEPGVFVWSHIDWHGTVILRYWTGDYAAGGIVWGDCPHCGLTIPRLVSPLWRAERDSTKIRGARVEYLALQDAVRGVPGVKTFQIVIEKSDPADAFSRDRLEVKAACAEASDPAAVEEGIRRALRDQLELAADAIRFLDEAEIEAALFAAKLKAEWIVDRRPTAA